MLKRIVEQGLLRYWRSQRGDAMLISVILAAMVVSALGLAVANINSAAFTGVSASGIAQQAQWLAQSRANEINVVAYANIGTVAEAKHTLAGSYNGNTFDREVIIGTPVNLGAGNWETPVTVNIYKTGEATPRTSLQLTPTSAASNSSVPTGTIIYFAASTAPAGFLECNGAVISATYPALATIIGTTYGAYGQLPDLRGGFARGWDHGKGTLDVGRVFGSTQQDQIQNITGVFVADKGTFNGFSGAFYSQAGWWQPNDTDATMAYGGTYYAMGFDASLVVRAGTETRPLNVALLPCIKY